MLTKDTYFGPKLGDPRITPDNEEHAQRLSDKVNIFLVRAERDGAYTWPTCPNTGTIISGSVGGRGMIHGTGDGGFRWSDSATGAALSAHKRADAVDIYDPNNPLDNWLSQYDIEGGGNTMLEEYGLYREAPDSTHGWCHLQDTPPHSGRRTFNP